MLNYLWFQRLYYLKDVLIDPEDLPPVFPNPKGFFDLNIFTYSGKETVILFHFKNYVEVNPLNKSKKWW